MVLVLIGLTFVVSRSCQQSQIKVTQTEAVAAAKRLIDFKPTSTTVRLLRQGLQTKPFWIVVMSVTRGNKILRLAQVHIDAKSGEITEVKQNKAAKGAGKKVPEP